MSDEWVVLQEPNKREEKYYCWQELTYSKEPKFGFYPKLQAKLICKLLNQKLYRNTYQKSNENTTYTTC